MSSLAEYRAPLTRFLSTRHVLSLLLVIAAAMVLGLAVAEAQWMYVGGLLFGLVTLLYPVQIGLGVYALLLPFDSISVLGQDSSGRALTWFAGVASGAVLLGFGLAGRRMHRPPRAAFWWTLFVLWGTATCLWALDQQVAVHQMPSFLALFVLYLITVSLRVTDKELDWIVGMYIVGGCLAGLFAIYQFTQGNFYEPVSMRASLSMAGHRTNPNFLAASLLLPMSFATGGVIRARRRQEKFILLCAVAIIGIGLLVTMSRGGILAVAIIMLVYFRRYNTSWRKMLAIVGVPLCATLLMMPHYYFVRWQDAARTGGANRLDIWQASLTALKQHGLWGAGLYNFPMAYDEVAGYAPRFLGYGLDAHNTLLAVTTELGVVGLLFFVVAIFSQFREAGKARRSPVPNSSLVAAEAACWALLVAGMFGNLLWAKTLWLSFMLLMLVAYQEQTRRPAVLPKSFEQ